MKARKNRLHKRLGSGGSSSGAVGIFFLVFSAMILVVAAYAFITLEPIARDEGLCPLTGPIRDVVVIVDKSDKWNNAQVGRIRNWFRNIRRELEENERLSILVFQSEAEYGFEPRFSLCNPGSGENKSSLTANLRRLKKAYEKSFEAPLKEILRDLVKPQEGGRSPILEVLADVTNRAEYKSRAGGRPKLIIFSDMIENSKVFSFFKPVEEFVARDELKRLGGIALQKFDLEVYQIRGKYSPELLGRVQRFWNDIADDLNAKISWKRL